MFTRRRPLSFNINLYLWISVSMTTVRLVRGSRECCLISINRSVVVAIVVVVVAMIIFNLSDSAVDVDSTAVSVAETRYYYFFLASQ